MDAEISPTTGAYTGLTIDHLGNAVYLRLMTPLGTWWADPTVGSRLHELEREKDLPRVRRLAVAYAEQALKPLLTDGRASAIAVTATASLPGTLRLMVTVTHATSGATKTFGHIVKVG